MIRRLDQILWGLTGAVLLGGALLAGTTARSLRTAAWALPAADGAPSPERSNTGDLARQISLGDPFRFDRRPSLVPFGTAPTEQSVVARYTARAPEVSGIVGPPWRAALEGVPGREGGVLVGVGDTLAGWRVVALRRDTIVIQAKDTTWRLAVRRP